MENTRKIALVTGGAKRIGKEVALYLASSGWELVIHYNNSLEEVRLLQEILQRQTKVFTIKADFSDLAEASKLISNIEDNFGSLSLLVNNASSFIKDNFDDFTADDFNYNTNVNYTAPAILIRDFYNQNFFKQNNYGNVINILDYSVFTHPTNFYSYNLAKKALFNLTETNAKLLAPKIRINGIAPGYVMLGDKQNPKNFISAVENSPLKIATSAEDIIFAIEFILKAQSLTGEVIRLDSGNRFGNV